MLKIAILSENSLIDAYTQRVLQPVSTDPRFKIVGIVVHPRPRKSFKQKIKAFKRRLKGGAFLVMIIGKFITKMSKTTYNTPDERKSFASVFSGQLFPELRFTMLNEAACEQLRQLDADLMILAGYHQIVSSEVINLLPRGVLSYHYGDMRKYRGQPPVFRELLNGESSIGITLQQITAGIDRGAPVEEMSLSIAEGETLASLEQRILSASEMMMYKALCRYLDPAYAPANLSAYGPVYTFPGLITWLRFHLKYSLFK
ncbi:MAG TPA: hypothetical protein DCR43_08495 [Bacteroidales bacterium]|nr:MAG: hypothetical protein A2X11_02880 [Bacteroidetes bacterium GWE2_42_24]OFY28829.1 MAG: hypothetical protein A2X09_12255 [Bacteroidetes bacterium GWF2_43_11]PKP23435.1 MAG: hypothetical protein CVU06_08265 [Bacteroidetes bacterium HGW-Bacteroidetes-22]HAQ65872.1 hypothetical protein [Bacteroidales bacterium]HBZ67660.1 hypothetical protein [Bacteroidales bacterium]